MILEKFAQLIKLFISRLTYVLKINPFASGQELWDGDFNDAKKLSDFVGMLLRLAFLTLATKYFFLKQLSEENIVLRYALISCAFFSFGLYFVLLIKINGVILNFWLSDLVYWKSKTSKFFIFLLSIILTAVASIGIYVFINDLSLTSSIFQKLNNENKINN